MKTDRHHLKRIAQRLINEGHGYECILAGRYACFRYMTLHDGFPAVEYDSSNLATAELFEAINACDDGEMLEELHAFVEDDYVNWGEPVTIPTAAEIKRARARVKRLLAKSA